jgi:hypothetical protein
MKAIAHQGLHISSANREYSLGFWICTLQEEVLKESMDFTKSEYWFFLSCGKARQLSYFKVTFPLGFVSPIDI